MLVGISIGFFALVLMTVSGAGYWFFIRRPSPAATSSAAAAAAPDFGDDRPQWAAKLQGLTDAAPFKGPAKPGLRDHLASAGIRASWAPSAFHSAQVVCASVTPVAVFLLLYVLSDSVLSALPGATLSAYIGYTIPEKWLRRKVRARRQAINRGLPDFLDLLVIAIESGLSLDQALADTARDLRKVHPELSDELGVFRNELLAGASRADALKNLGKRVGEPELRKLTSLLIQADRFGSSVSKMLRTQARYMRIRRRQLAEEKAHKVGVKLLFPIFFLIMPSVFLVTAGPAVVMLVSNFGRIAGDM